MTRPFFDSDLPPTPSSRSRFLEFRRVTLFFTAVHLLSVYFGLASRSIFCCSDCVTLQNFLRFTPLVTRDAIYERPLSTFKLSSGPSHSQFCFSPSAAFTCVLNITKNDMFFKNSYFLIGGATDPKEYCKRTRLALLF